MVPAAKPPAQYFASVVSSIISQQISTKAAAAVQARVVQTLGGTIDPEAVTATPEEELRAAGLSRQKVKYLKHNAEAWPSLHTSDWPALDDEAIITELSSLYGIGRWTAEMFLIFSLGRPDVFSFGDLGLMAGLYQCYPELRPHYVRKIEQRVASWSPHRTTASLVLWWHKDGGPVLL